MISSFFSKMLNKKQDEVVKCNKDSLVIAGAGSGKTFTLIKKINNLISNNVKKEDILVISYTNEACNEITNRLNNNLKAITFHKLALGIILNDNNIDFDIREDYIKKDIEDFILNIIPSKKKLLGNVLKFLCYFNSDVRIDYSNLIFEESNIKFNLDYINNNKNNYYDIYKYLLLNKRKFFMEKFSDLLINTVYILKENNYEYTKKTNNERVKLYLNIIKEFIIFISNKNKSKDELILDFNDMINEAINIVKNDKIKLNYKYILIDEFQDISFNRFKLILEIKEKTNAVVTAFGDDFQSIYGFSGSRIDIFLNFQKYIKGSVIFKLEQSYRNPKELLEITNNFILYNKNQMIKKMFSNKNIKNTVIKVKAFYSIYDGLKKSIDIIKKEKKDASILVLSRYEKLLGLEKYFKSDKIRFLTIHKSKGLEADYVVILDVSNKTYGIPCLLEDDEVILHFKNINKIENYYEERRLFYVALTRTRNKVFLVLTHNESMFLKEIEHKTVYTFKKYSNIKRCYCKGAIINGRCEHEH